MLKWTILANFRLMLSYYQELEEEQKYAPVISNQTFSLDVQISASNENLSRWPDKIILAIAELIHFV